MILIYSTLTQINTDLIKIIDTENTKVANNQLAYHNQQLLDKTEEDYVKKIRKDRNKEKWAKRISIPFSFSHVTIFTCVTLIAFFLLFPATPLPMLALLFGAGFIVDGIMYAGDVSHAFKMFFGKGLLKAFLLKGLFSDLDKFILKRELQKSAKTDPSLKHFFQYIDNKATEEIERQFPNCDEKKKKQKIKNRQKELRDKYLELYITKWDVYKNNLVKHQQKNSKHNQFYAKGQARSYINNTHRRLGSLGREEKKPLFMFGSRIEKIKKQYKKEFILKKFLIALGAFSAVVNGIGFGCMVFTHILPVLTIIMSPSLAIFPMVAIAALGAFIYGMLMYKTISNAIKKNIFKKLIQRFGLKRDENTPKWKHYTSLIAKIAIVAGVGAVASIAMTLAAGAWLDAIMAVLGIFTPTVGPLANILVQTIVFGIIMPVNIIFSIYHASGTINKFARLGKQLANHSKNGIKKWGGLATQKDKSFKESMTEKPLTTLGRLIYKPFTETISFIIHHPAKTFKYCAYALGGVIAVGSLAIHLIVEAAMTAGEGANSDTNWPGKLFQKITGLLKLNSVTTALAGSCIQEGLEHFDFIFIYFKPFSRPFYAWPKRMLNFLKNPKEDVNRTIENRKKSKQAKKIEFRKIKAQVDEYKNSEEKVPTQSTHNHSFTYYNKVKTTSHQRPAFRQRRAYHHRVSPISNIPVTAATAA